MEKTVVCLKWGPPPYSADWINRLYRGVKRNLTPPFRFVAFTDETEGLEPAIEARDIDLLSFTPRICNFWWKLALPHPDAGLSGRCLFLDLDNVIVGSLDGFFDHPGEFCVIRNWINRRKRVLRTWPRIFNSSVYRFEAGAHPELAEAFIADPDRAEDKRFYTTEQRFMTEQIGAERATWWPYEWVRSYKYDMRPPFPLNWFRPPQIPPGARILCLTGYPKPHQAISEGARGALHRRMLPMPELQQYWN